MPGATKEYSRYLSTICAGCHSKSIADQLKGWEPEDFVRAFHTGVLPGGKPFGPTMSSKAFSEMTDMELTALWPYVVNGKVHEIAQAGVVPLVPCRFALPLL